MSRQTRIPLKVALGIIINAHHEVLVACRPEHASHGWLWEFPGGKWELGETGFEALAREVHEEVGIEVLEAVPFMCLQHDYGSLLVELDAWRVTRFKNEPYGREGQKIQWVDSIGLMRLEFPAGNRSIIDAVKEIL